MSDDGDGEQSVEDVHRDILALRNRLEAMAHGVEINDFTPGRRGAMKIGTAAVVGAGAMATFGRTASASDGSASGQIGTAASPALRVYVDTFHFHERTSDPSSPSNGDMWYNSSA